jgi:hypothetical protein
MGLDCITPKGRGYIAAQSDCLKRLEELWGIQAISTANDGSVAIDAILADKGVICGVAEVKSREMDLAKLQEYGSYLITFEKVVRLREISASLGVPGLIVVSLLKDKSIVFWKICDKAGHFLVSIETKVSSTQSTCNGGQAHRYNAYLSLDQMVVIDFKGAGKP